jgi:hypothetical protein
MPVVATIVPNFTVEPEELLDIEKRLTEVTGWGTFMRLAPLHEYPTVTLPAAEFDGDLLENYEFVVTRRFSYDGECYVGGVNGEVLNVDAFIGAYIAFLESQRNINDQEMEIPFQDVFDEGTDIKNTKPVDTESP